MFIRYNTALITSYHHTFSMYISKDCLCHIFTLPVNNESSSKEDVNLIMKVRESGVKRKYFKKNPLCWNHTCFTQLQCKQTFPKFVLFVLDALYLLLGLTSAGSKKKNTRGPAVKRWGKIQITTEHWTGGHKG